MTEITDFNFAEDVFTAADLAKFELIKLDGKEDLNSLAELLNQVVAAKVAKLSQEKDEFYSKQLASKELESDTFYNQSPCGYFSTAANGIINKINDTLLVWLGFAKEDIIDKVTWQSLLSVGGKMYFETHYSPLLQLQGFVQEISFEMVKKDKTRLPILINTKQIRDENGKVQINYSTVFDVSQRRSYEKELLIAKSTAEEQNKLINETNEKLLASEEELKRKIEEVKTLNKLVEYTFKNASIPIYFVLEDASIYNFNDIAAENLGYTSEELHTLKMYDLDKDFDEKKWASIWDKLKEKKKITVETQQKKKDGSLIDVIITANYVKYGDLELNCSFVLDVTEKKKQEKELKLIDFTFSNSAIPIFLVKEDSSIYNINDAAAKGLAYSQEELKGKKIIEIDDNFDKDKWALHWADVKAKESITIETTNTKKDGTIGNFIININYLKHGDLELLCSYAIDITEKKKLEQQLNLLDYSYSHTNSAMFFLDMDGFYIDFNQATANLLGYSYEEFRGITVFDVNPLLTKESWAKLWEELKDVPNQNFGVKLKRKDGTFIDVAVTTNSIELNDKIVNFGFYEDITEKKKLEDNLKLSAYTIDNAAWGLAYIKADGSIYNCNLAFAKLYGNTSLEDMKTKTAFDFGSAYTIDTWKQYWDELKQKKSLHYIAKRTKNDGTSIDLEINANMIQFGDLELNCIYVNDVTEKKKAEAEIYSVNELLQRQTNRLLLATKSAKLGIWDRDLENDSIFWDEGMYKLYGIAADEFKANNEGWLARLHEEDRARINKEMQLNIANKNEFNSEFRIVWNDASVHYIKTAGFIERVEGKPKRIIGVSWDVTMEKEAELEKETLLKELVANNLELKQFTYITSHNLRAPLTNLVTICNIIQPENITDAFTRQLIEGFKKSTYHLNDTLNDLMEILIIKEDRNRIKVQLTFEEIFKKITESLSISLHEQRVIINADFADAPAVIFANEYLESVFLNLVTNSVKYRHPDRDPIIAIKTSKEPNGDIKLTFADNGIGINMAFAKDKIFGLYKRFHNNADSKGIGLYLVHSQITTLGGKIEVESEVNIGTTFTITFK